MQGFKLLGFKLPGFKLALLCLLLGSLLLGACGGVSEEVDATFATLDRVRGGAELGEEPAARAARVGLGQAIATGERSESRLTLDTGARLLLDEGTTVSLAEADALVLEEGRLFAELAEHDRFELRIGEGEEASIVWGVDAAFSITKRGQEVTLHAVRGEVSYRSGETRGVTRAGETLRLGGGEPEVSPTTLFSDWTGGLAQPGPLDATGPEGVGALEARVPDAIGQARWPLVMRRLDAHVQIRGDLAITEVEQVFFNPASETVEGLYRIRVPEGAVLQRFAVDRNGHLVDGYVREKAQARAAYQAQVYRGSTDDPALLEWDAPGAYRARIYPIAAGETRRIVIRYAEWLTRPGVGAPRIYRYPLGGGRRPPHIQELSIRAEVSEAGAQRVRAGLGAAVEEGEVRLRRSDFRPRSDFFLELIDAEGQAGSQAGAQRAYRAEHQPPPRAPNSRAIPNEADERDYYYLPLAVPTDLLEGEQGRTGGLDVVVVADVSAATERSQLELGRSVVEAIAARLGEQDRLAVVTSDLTIRPLGGGEAALGEAHGERLERLLDGLARVPAGGATDLGEAIARAAELLDAEGSGEGSAEGGAPRSGAVVYVGDGAPTVGELRAEGLLDRLGRLPKPLRLYAVAVGSDAQLELLESLTRGGGLSLRVEQRAEAAEAALELMAHLSRPIAQRVTVELGAGIDNVYPRRPVDVVLGDVLPVVGRVRGELPVQVRIRGEIAGQPFEREIRVAPGAVQEPTDLRLRWAGERLRQLLLQGATREEVAELGTRYGLITPFTSYYVPSARELGQMSDRGRSLLYQRLRWASREPGLGRLRGHRLGVAPLLLPLGLAACFGSEDASLTPSEEEAPAWLSQGAQPQAQLAPGSPAPVTAVPAMPTTTETATGADMAAAEGMEQAEGEMANDNERAAAANAGAIGVLRALGPGAAGGGSEAFGGDGDLARQQLGATGYAMAEPNEPSADPAPPPAQPPADGLIDPFEGGGGGGGGYGGGYGRSASAGSTTASARASDDLRERPEARFRRSRAPMAGAFGGRDRGSRGEDRLDANLEEQVRWHTAPDNRNSDSSLTLPIRDHSELALLLDGEEDSGDDETGAELPSGSYHIQITTSGYGGRGNNLDNGLRLRRQARARAHLRSRCSDAADLLLDDRKALWRERLGQESAVLGWIRVYHDAIQRCEAPTWRDRRALLGLILQVAGTVPRMIQVYQYLPSGAARGFLRSAILGRVRTPDDLRAVRLAFGLGGGVDWELVEQILERAGGADGQIRALRQLMAQHPENMDLALRLLEVLERAGRTPQVHRLAARLRANPLADPGVRTAIGEIYLRAEREDDARRVFSEIVEFAPLDELARRRLGDLYRAHGWFEDAYRQYQTLAEIRPDDTSVLLLLAQAAAGAGRVDEALRLEQRLIETAAPGMREGLSRVALLWSSVRYARLRKSAREAEDQERLEALTTRMRRSGVLRAASSLRVALTWAHPDAQISLWASHPGSSLSRPEDLAATYGIEVFDVPEQEDGSYRIEVRRADAHALTALSAELLVMWNEGGEGERIERVPLRFDADHTTFAWRVEGTSLESAE